MTPFLRNCWYMAGWSEAIAPGDSLSRTIIGLPILLHRRDSDARLLASDDRCPHRFAPLSMGRSLGGGRVQCGYHGLEFDLESGQCIRNPHGRNLIPKQLRLRTYEIVERYGIIWLWPGDAEADEKTIPDYAVLDTPSEYVSRRDHMRMDVPYDLIVDNLVDCSHVNFLHDGILGNVEMNAAGTTIEQAGETLTVKRYMRNVPPPGVHDRLFRNDGASVDHWLNFRWNLPSSLLLDTGITVPGGSREEGTGYFGVHILTPETATTTHYHTCASRWNVTPGSEVEDVRRELADLRLFAFQQQDEPMIRAQFASMQSMPAATRQVLIETDIGVARWRKIYGEHQARESEVV